MISNSKNLGYLLVGFSVILFVILVFIKIQVDKQSAFLCEKFHENKLDMSECPVHKTNSFWANVSWMVTLAFGINVLIFGLGVYLAFFYKFYEKELKKELKEVDTSKFSDGEKKIYDVIKSKDGSAYQSDLMKETGFSKVKVTRILDKLESMNILERKRRGMTNLIVLK